VTGAVRRFQPDLVLFVDAACMDEQPGAVRWLDPQDADGMCASTHTLPLSMVAGYLAAEVGCQTALIGIQPGSLNMRAAITPAVMSAVRDITATLLNTLQCVQE
jgi:hydrogenase 3 maturation protease